MSVQRRRIQTARQHNDERISTSEDVPAAVNALLRIATISLVNGRQLGEAIVHCEAAIQLDRENAEPYLLRSCIYYKLRNLARAIDDWKESARLDSTLPKPTTVRVADFHFEQLPISDLYRRAGVYKLSPESQPKRL